MSDLFFGGEVSGTPLETRAGTGQFANELLTGGTRLQQGAAQGALGFGPQGVGIERAVMSLLSDPADRLRGLFASLVPFEERQTEEAVAGVRGSFGRLGGRFSENLLNAETRTRGELGAQFARTRNEALLAAQGQQSQALASILQALLGARGQTLDFFQPGAPNFREGFFGDLLAAGGEALGGFFESGGRFRGGPEGNIFPGGFGDGFSPPTGPGVEDRGEPRGPVVA